MLTTISPYKRYNIAKTLTIAAMVVTCLPIGYALLKHFQVQSAKAVERAEIQARLDEHVQRQLLAQQALQAQQLAEQKALEAQRLAKQQAQQLRYQIAEKRLTDGCLPVAGEHGLSVVADGKRVLYGNGVLPENSVVCDATGSTGVIGKNGIIQDAAWSPNGQVLFIQMEKRNQQVLNSLGYGS